MAEASFLARAGLRLAVVAIAVNAPRLVLAFLAADGVAVDERLRAALLGVTGLATGIVLTGGGAYLAHAVARHPEHRTVLVVTWLLVLTCAALLVTPMLVAGLGGVQLAEVLPSSLLRWAWSAVAVIAVELVAAGSMVAHGAEVAGEQRAAQAEGELVELARERNRLQAELSRRPSQPEPPAPPPSRRSRSALAPAAGAVPCRNGCGFVGRSLRAEAGHQRACPSRPEPDARARSWTALPTTAGGPASGSSEGATS